ncbi:MAG: hypothetical protein V4760_02985 [Bdellovibrionota bacterium]
MFALVMSSCSMKQEGPSRVVLQLPSVSTLNGSSKISRLSYIWANACFSVSVTGDSIEMSAPNQCSVPSGVFKGSVGPGGSLAIEVPRGSARKLEVFAFFRSNSVGECPSASTLAAFDPEKTVRVGETTFDAMSSEVNVAVEVSLPNAGTNLISQYSLPATCSTATYVPGTGSSTIGAGTQRQTGGNFIAQSTVSGRQSEKVLQGGSFVMKLTRRPNEE